MWKWLTRSEFMNASADAERLLLRLEELEAREVPAVLIQLDYTYDNGFFRNNPAAQAVMQQVATELGNSISANLAALTPSGSNQWTASFFNPATGAVTNVSNLVIGANTIKVFVGSRALGGGEAGVGGFGGYGISGSAAWISTVQNRNWSGFAPWGGSIAFDNTKNWYFGSNTSGLTSTKLDFYSVAYHEMGHLLGLGTSPQFKALSSGGYFNGYYSTHLYGGPVPLSPDGAHWRDGITVKGLPVSLDPTINYGVRVAWNSLDALALRDIGWGGPTTAAPPPAASPPPAAVPTPPVFTPQPVGSAKPVAFTGSTNGIVTMYTVSNGVLASTGQTLYPFVGYRGAIRVAGGDFNGDGIQDYAFTVGAGPQAVVQILNGRDGSVMVNQTAIFPGFRGGMFVAAADIDRDGKAELVVSADVGAGPHIQTFKVVGAGLQLQASFFAFDNPFYRGGARVSAGDLNRDGYADVVVSTGGLAEGRVAVYSGASLARGVAARLTSDFNPFPGVAAAVNTAVGDLNGDGYAELAVSLDRGAPGHVKVWAGNMISGRNPGAISPVASFYAFPPTDPSGARLAIRDMNGDGRAELVVGSGNQLNSMARVFSYEQAIAGGGGAPISYPTGSTRTYDGIYAGEHTDSSGPADSGSDQQAALPNDGTTHDTFTASAAPVLHNCNCAACRALADLASVANDPFLSTIPVA
jgi:hypothetical protein